MKQGGIFLRYLKCSVQKRPNQCFNFPTKNVMTSVSDLVFVIWRETFIFIGANGFYVSVLPFVLIYIYFRVCIWSRDFFF